MTPLCVYHSLSIINAAKVVWMERKAYMLPDPISFMNWVCSQRHLACVGAKSHQSCPTLCNPMNYNLPGSSVHGTLQATIVEWAAMPSCRGSSQPRVWAHVSYVSCICSLVLTTSTTWETHEMDLILTLNSHFIVKKTWLLDIHHDRPKVKRFNTSRDRMKPQEIKLSAQRPCPCSTLGPWIPEHPSVPSALYFLCFTRSPTVSGGAVLAPSVTISLCFFYSPVLWTPWEKICICSPHFAFVSQLPSTLPVWFLLLSVRGFLLPNI